MKRTIHSLIPQVVLPFCAVLSIASLGESTASAAPPSTMGESSLFLMQHRKGMRLAQQRHWQEAIDAFLAAYDARVRPHPELLLFIAKAHLKLGQGGPALLYYRKFVGLATAPTDAQRVEVTEGMIHAQELLDAEASDRGPSHPTSDASKPPGRAPKDTPLAEGKSESAKPPLVEAPSSVAPVAKQKTEDNLGERPVQKSVRAMISGRNSRIPYTVSTNSGENLCTSPCELNVTPGPALVTVSGPGQKQFQKEVLLPAVPFQMTVQHFTLSRVIAGSLLMVFSAGFAAGGTIAVITMAQHPEVAVVTATPLLLHGLVFFFVGLGQLASIKRNTLSIQPLAGSLAMRPRAVQLSNLDVQPTADRRGAIASLRFRF